MPKIHYWHIHGSLCLANVPRISLTKYSGLVTCKNCLWFLEQHADRIKRGENAVGRTYSRQVMMVKRTIWEFRTNPPLKGWPTIYDLADYLSISIPRVFDICDTEPTIRLNIVRRKGEVVYGLTEASLVVH